MKISKKMKKVFKKAAEYFVASAGSVSFIVGMVAVFILIPPYISVPLIVGTGLVLAVVQGYKLWKRYDVEEAEARRLEEEKQDSRDARTEMLIVAHDMSMKISDLQERIEHTPLLPMQIQQDGRYYSYPYTLPVQSPLGEDKRAESAPGARGKMPLFFEQRLPLTPPSLNDSPVIRLPVIHDMEEEVKGVILPRAKSL